MDKLFEVNSEIIQIILENYKKDPRRTIIAFRETESAQKIIGEFYAKSGVDPRYSIAILCNVVCLSGSAALFKKVPNMYVLHILFHDSAEVLLLFNEGLSICESAYRLDASMDYYTIYSGGRISLDDSAIKEFKGRDKYYVDYSFASQFADLLKPQRMSIFTMLPEDTKKFPFTLTR